LKFPVDIETSRKMDNPRHLLTERTILANRIPKHFANRIVTYIESPVKHFPDKRQTPENANTFLVKGSRVEIFCPIKNTTRPLITY